MAQSVSLALYDTHMERLEQYCSMANQDLSVIAEEAIEKFAKHLEDNPLSGLQRMQSSLTVSKNVDYVKRIYIDISDQAFDKLVTQSRAYWMKEVDFFYNAMLFWFPFGDLRQADPSFTGSGNLVTLEVPKELHAAYKARAAQKCDDFSDLVTYQHYIVSQHIMRRVAHPIDQPFDYSAAFKFEEDDDEHIGRIYFRLSETFHQVVKTLALSDRTPMKLFLQTALLLDLKHNT